MAEKKPEVFTFHRVRERCEQADPEAWRAFLTFYSPLHQHLLAMYAPGRAAAAAVWKQTLESLAANNFERFRATARKSEREFLTDLRALLLETLVKEDAKSSGGQSASAPAPQVAASEPASAAAPESAAGGAGLDPEKLAKLLEGLPMLHQEMLFFKLAGYGDATIEKMLRVAPRVAEKSFERLLPDYAVALKIEKDRCPWPREWLAIFQHARTAKKEDCAELHNILRVHDGQVSWYEKEPIEKHVSGCLYCLERWAALREVGYWRREAPAASEAQIEEWLRVLPVRVEKQKKSLFQRVFG